MNVARIMDTMRALLKRMYYRSSIISHQLLLALVVITQAELILKKPTPLCEPFRYP